MTLYYQETDSKAVLVWPSSKFSYPVTARPANETIGRKTDSYHFRPLSESTTLIETARQVIHQQTENPKVTKEAEKTLSIFQDTVASLQQLGVEVNHLPPLHAFNVVDDGSVLIEWIFRDFRIGFTVEPNPKDSGWYLVSNKNLGEISASGHILSDRQLRSRILWLIGFVLSNY